MTAFGTGPSALGPDRASDDVCRRVLVAYNDTPTARRALERATELARAHGADLLVLAIQDRLPHYAATRGEVY
jgi:nucleotide-binding universal stress UspA family protein